MDATDKPRVSPLEFFRQVRQEISKVTWPTRKETLISSIMVLILVAIAGVFFLFVDSIISWVVTLILG